MLSDGRLELDSKVPLKLIKQLMDIDESLLSFDSYIISMVKAYIRHKRQIVLNMHGLELEVLQGFVTDGEFKRTKTTKDDWRPESLSSSRLNLISPDLISKFPNATTIVIKTSDGAGDFIYPFDMFYFLTSIQQALNWKLIKIEQFVRNKKNFGKSWIAKLWRSSKDKLMNDYKEQLKISFHEQEIKTGDGFDQSVEYFRIIRE